MSLGSTVVETSHVISVKPRICPMSVNTLTTSGAWPSSPEEKCSLMANPTTKRAISSAMTTAVNYLDSHGLPQTSFVNQHLGNQAKGWTERARRQVPGPG